MRTPTEFEIKQFMAHVYDPVKAHEYYMKNRDLKGRKKGKTPKLGGLSSIAGQTKKLQSRRKFIDKTAMREDGASAEISDKFVRTLQSKSDKELKDISKMLKDADAKQTGPSAYGAQAATVDALLANRAKIRSGKAPRNSRDPRTGKTRDVISKEARAKQRKELNASIQNLESKLKKLEARIREMEHEEASDDRKGKAKKERSAKEHEKPKSAAEKADAARENEKYRDKHKQELKTKAKKESGKSDGGSTKTKSKTSSSKASLSDLKAVATRVRGQIAVANLKLAAL